jgi:fermentation-respiration switch protein FrsA (DUF1100 family)
MRYVKLLVSALLLLFFSACSGIFFHPDAKVYANPSDFGLSYSRHVIVKKDGSHLDAWHIKPALESKGLMVVAHGNAQNITAHFRAWNWLVASGYEVFIFDYQGYGKSEGEASLDGAVSDVADALNYVEESFKKSYYLCGQSLGGSLSIAAVSQKKRPLLDALIIDATFSSFPGIVSEKLSYFFLTWPFQWIPHLTISDKYDALALVPQLSYPVLFIHGSLDKTISPNHTWQLFDKARKPKEFWIASGAGHIASLQLPQIQKAFLEFLIKVKKGSFYHENYSVMKIFH